MGRERRDRGFAEKRGLFGQLLTGLGLNWGKGGVTHTRASTVLYADTADYYQQVAIDVPAFDSTGLRVTPQLTNKCQCYGLIPDDAEQTALTSGTMTVGKVYKIKVQESTTDFVADGASNPHAVGDTFVCTASTVTLTATKSVAEMKWAIGTKTLYSGGAWKQNIDGLVVSGDTGGVVEIVDFTSTLATAKLNYIATNNKAYKQSGGSSAVSVMIGGAVGNTNPHSFRAFASGTGTARIYLNATGDIGNATGTFSLYGVNNITPSGTTRQLTAYTNAGGTLYFLLPGLYETIVAPKYPVRANSTSASTTRAQTTVSVPLSPNFNQGSFQVTVNVTPDFALANIPNSTNVAIATLTSGTANNLLYFAKDGSGNGSLNCHDGTNTATIAWTPVAGTTYKVGCRGNSATGKIQVSLNGTNGDEATYDGGIAADGQNKAYLQGINGGFSIKNLRISPDRGAAALAAATT